MKNHTEKKVSDYTNFPTYFFLFTHPKALLSVVSFIKTVLKDFFLIQFARKFGLTKTPIAKVDNELDELIPFTPSKVATYLDFTAFWIRPMSMLIKRLDSKKAQHYVIEFMNYIKLAYSSASKIYRMCMTTTDRPHYYKMFYFRVIHTFDPHFLCVPSLHISVVSLVWAFYRKAFNELDEFTQQEKDSYIEEMYNGAIEIAETVLYIKQHSVNCIPAALYMMTHLMQPYFTPEDGIQFLRDMFVNTEISLDKQIRIKEYMYFIYERFLLVGTADENWITPIKAWLKEYCNKTNQAYIAKKIK